MYEKKGDEEEGETAFQVKEIKRGLPQETKAVDSVKHASMTSCSLYTGRYGSN